MPARNQGPEPEDLISGSLEILGLKIDLSKLLAAPEELAERLEALRERLTAASGGETPSVQGSGDKGLTISGHIRTRGILGERDYHLGATRPPRARGGRGQAPAEPVEPPVDVFDEGDSVAVIAEVPGVTLKDLELAAQERSLSISTVQGAPRRYRKELDLPAAVDPSGMTARCRNGVLEVRLPKKRSGPASP